MSLVPGCICERTSLSLSLLYAESSSLSVTLFWELYKKSLLEILPAEHVRTAVASQCH